MTMTLASPATVYAPDTSGCRAQVARALQARGDSTHDFGLDVLDVLTGLAPALQVALARGLFTVRRHGRALLGRRQLVLQMLDPLHQRVGAAAPAAAVTRPDP